MVQHPYMYFLIISVTREQKHSLVMGSWVSKCGFRIPNMFQRTRRDSIRMLYPKRTKFRKCQKGKCRGCRTDGTRLSFGEYGIKSCSAGRIPYQTIEAARRAISRHFQRNGRIWVRIFADIPITRKPTEVRMGKGKGNPTGWMARVVTG